MSHINRNTKILLTLLILILFSLTLILIINNNHVINVKTISCVASWKLSNKDDNPNYAFFRPIGIRYKSGYLYVLDSGNNRIMKYDDGGNFITQIGRFGRGPGELINPRSFAVHKDGTIFVLNLGNSRVEIYDSAGKYKNSFKFENRIFSQSHQLEIDRLKNIYLPSEFNSSKLLSVYDSSGHKIKDFGDKLNFTFTSNQWHRNNVIQFIADNHDNLYVQFVSNPILRKYDRSGELIWERNYSQLPNVKKISRIFDEDEKKDISNNGISIYSFVFFITIAGNKSIIVDAPQPYLVEESSYYPKAIVHFYFNKTQFYPLDITCIKGEKYFVLGTEGNIYKCSLT